MLKRLFACVIVIVFLFLSAFVSVSAVSVVKLYEDLISEGFILIDGDTGQILVEKNVHRVLRPASITKVMTALLALENGDLDDIVTVSSEALSGIDPSAASIFLRSGEELTLEQALYAMAVTSAADASNVIAEHISGSVDGFVRQMNARAIELGALSTTFVNTHGMPDRNHLTTAFDMALISMAAVNTPGFNEIFNAHVYTIPPTNLRERPRVLRNLNRMMTGAFVYDGLIAGKTGWTRSSEYTLFAAAERDGRTLIGISIKTPQIDDKYIDMTKMFNYGFDELDCISFSAYELDRLIPVDFEGYEDHAAVTVHEDFNCLIPKAFSKDDIGIEYIIESFYSTGEDTDNEDHDMELHIRVVFSLDESADWVGSFILGEVTATAFLIEQVLEEEDELFPEDEPPESDEAVLPGEPPESDGNKQEEPAPTGNGHADSNVYFDSGYLLEIYRSWGWVIKDAGILIVMVVILVCYVIIRGRK